jgi:two-component system cell cycle sensor histidine kinase/response regulator CckA
MPEGRKEVILFSEDDEVVWDLISNMLEGFGYTVIVTGGGEEGVRKFFEYKDSIRLVVVDMVMPKKGGKDVYDEIKMILPDIKVIFISGYDKDIVARKGIFSTGMLFIAKPFSARDLLDAIRKVLYTKG